MYKSRIFAEMLSPVGSSLGSALSFKSSSPTIKSDSKEKLGKTQDSDTVTGFKRLLTRKTSSAKKPEPLTPKKVNAEAYHLDGFLGGAIKMQPVADMEDDDDEDSEEED